jgi:FAD/FMN-containing dehydrogenase
MRGNHAWPRPVPHKSAKPKALFRIPLDLPSIVLNPFTVRAFNEVYYRAQIFKTTRKLIGFDPFFYPLDSILEWNRMYGSAGFLQYQCVVPYKQDRRAIKDIFRTISASGEGSFLVVLKTFGEVESPGLLSFPRQGVTLALDFPYRGRRTLDLLERLDRIVLESKGAVYPAKDARMSAKAFQAFYPNWREFCQYIDPKFSSSFWRRVTQTG